GRLFGEHDYGRQERDVGVRRTGIARFQRRRTGHRRTRERRGSDDRAAPRAEAADVVDERRVLSAAPAGRRSQRAFIRAHGGDRTADSTQRAARHDAVGSAAPRTEKAQRRAKGGLLRSAGNASVSAPATPSRRSPKRTRFSAS